MLFCTMNRYRLSLLFAWLLALTGCGQLEPSVSEAQRVDPARITVIDVRTPEEYAQKHLRGTTNVPLDELGSRIASVAPDKDAPLAVHCRSGRRSAVAREILQQQGYRNVQDLGSFENASVAIEGR